MGQLTHERLDIVESMVKGLRLSEAQRAELLASLRKFRMVDDDDPLLKITFATGIMAQFMAEIPDKMQARYWQVDASLADRIADLEKKLNGAISTMRSCINDDNHGTELLRAVMDDRNVRGKEMASLCNAISEDLGEILCLYERVERKAVEALNVAASMAKHKEEMRKLRICGYAVAASMALLALVAIPSSCATRSNLQEIKAQELKQSRNMELLTELFLRKNYMREEAK